MVKRVDEIDVRGRVTFVRADLDVPLDGRRIEDPSRIDAALPTLRHLVKAGARVVVAGGLGRPRGRDPERSLEPVGAHLAAALDRDVVLADDAVGDGVTKNVRDLREGEVLLLENLRFHPAEERNDEEFARALAHGVDVYVGEAFAASHRAHASTAGMVRFVRDRALGLRMAKELEMLRPLVESPPRPFVVVFGGATVTDKINAVDHLLKKADTIVIGGAMAYTFLKARGAPVGSSRVDAERVEAAGHVLKAAEAKGVRLLLPVDHLVADRFDANAEPEVASEIREGFMGLDVGPKTLTLVKDELARARAVFWDGPLGVCEWERFAGGTTGVARAIAEARAHTVIGGDDTLAAARRAGVLGRITHVTTGGEASLALLEGRVLPGVEALEGGDR